MEFEPFALGRRAHVEPHLRAAAGRGIRRPIAAALRVRDVADTRGGEPTVVVEHGAISHERLEIPAACRVTDGARADHQAGSPEQPIRLEEQRALLQAGALR